MDLEEHAEQLGPRVRRAGPRCAWSITASARVAPSSGELQIVHPHAQLEQRQRRVRVLREAGDSLRSICSARLSDM